MRKAILLVLIFVCFSCNKEKFTTESLLLENLKESSSFYKSECETTLGTIEGMYADRGRTNGKFDTLNLITKKIGNLLKDLKSKNKQQRIALQAQKVKEINSLKSEYKIDVINVSKLEVLDEEAEDMSLDEIQGKFNRAKEGLKLLLMAWARYEDELPDGRRKNEARDARWSWGSSSSEL